MYFNSGQIFNTVFVVSFIPWCFSFISWFMNFHEGGGPPPPRAGGPPPFDPPLANITDVSNKKAKKTIRKLHFYINISRFYFLNTHNVILIDINKRQCATLVLNSITLRMVYAVAKRICSPNRMYRSQTLRVKLNGNLEQTMQS